MKKLNERGVSAVEFALLLPVLVLIIFGIVEGGMMLYDKAVITNASREVARAAITLGTNTTDIQNIKNNVVSKYAGSLISFGADTLEVSDIVLNPVDGCAHWTPAFSNPIQVTVSYNYECLVLAPILGLFGGNWNGTLPLQAITTMRCE